MRVVTMSRRVMRGVVFALAATALASALAVSAGAKPTRQQAETLRIMLPTSFVPSFEAVKADFENRYPGISLDLAAVQPAQLGPLYNTQFRAGNAPDIMFMNPGRSSSMAVFNFADQGYLLDLAGRPWEKRLTGPLLVGLKQGKHLWATSTGAVLGAMIYNVDLFRQLGVRVPKTFGQLLTVCRRVSAAGKIPIAWSPGEAARSVIFTWQIAASTIYAKNPKLNAQRQAGKVSFATTWRPVFDHIAAMKQANCFSPGIMGTTADGAPALLGTGQAAMYPGLTNHFALVLQSNPNLNYGVFPFPGDKERDTRLILNPYAVLVANAKLSGEKRAAAIQFLDFIGRPGQQAVFNKAAGAVLSPLQVKNKVNPATAFPVLRPFATYVKRPIVAWIPSVWPNSLVLPAVVSTTQGIFTGQKTIAEGLAEMDAAFKRGKI